MNTRRLIMVAYLCFTSLSAFAQNNVLPCPGTVWTNRVQRTVYLDTTIKHTLADTTLAEVLTKLVLDKKLTPYSTFDNRFTTKLSREKILEKISSHADNANQQEDPVTGSTNTRVVMHEFNYSNICAYRVVEEWQYNVDEGKIDIQILGIAPVVDVYGDEGNYRGSVGMYWLKYEDAKDAIAEFNKTHAKSNFYKPIWKSYCNGQIQPFNTDTIQSGQTYRIAIVRDTTDYYGYTKLRSADDSLLPEILLDQAEQKHNRLPLYDTGIDWESKPLSLKDVKMLTYIKPDYSEIVDPLTGQNYQKVVMIGFKMESINHFKLIQQIKYGKLTGHITLTLLGVELQKDVYNDSGQFVQRNPMATFKYADIKPIINRYTMQHPFCNLPLELWRGYFTERE